MGLEVRIFIPSSSPNSHLAFPLSYYFFFFTELVPSVNMDESENKSETLTGPFDREKGGEKEMIVVCPTKVDQ